MPATTRDDPLRHAAETRGTVTILCHECEEEVASAARAVGQDLGIEPGIDRAPAEGFRVGCHSAGGEGQPPVT